MKKTMLFMLVLTMAFGTYMFGCGSDDAEGTEGAKCRGWVEPCDPTCAAGEVCNDGTCEEVTVVACDPTCEATQWCNAGTCEDIPVCDPACGAGEYCNDGTCETPELPCDTGLTCSATGICEAGETDGDVDGDEDETPVDNSGKDGEACRAEAPFCDDDLECTDNVCGAAAPVCEDDSCPGIELCDTDTNECTDDAAIVCIADKYNQDCPGKYDMSTEAYGECTEIDCTSDEDCQGLASCDTDGSSRTPACNATDSKCEMN